MGTKGTIQLPPDATGQKVQTYVDASDATIEHPTQVPVDSNGAPVAQQYSTLRTTPEPHGLFFDPLESLDTNRWGTAGTAPSFASGSVVLASSTTAAATSQLISVPTFIQQASAFLQCAFAIKLDAVGAAVTGAHRFWGQGTAPATPATTSAATKLTDAWGFELDTDGKLYAVVYAAGVRIFAADLSASGNSKQKLDGAYHRYVIQVRSDRIYWLIDDMNDAVATTTFATPTTQQLPLRIQQVNNVTTQTAAPTLQMQSIAVVDTASNHSQIADSTYPWRKATVDTNGRLKVTTAGETFVVQTQNVTTATGAATFTGLSAAGNIQITVKGTYGFTTTPPTYTWEGSDDGGSNWFAISAVREDLSFKERGGTLGVNGTRAWTLDLAGLDQVRVRFTAWGTPSGTMVFRGSPGGTFFEPPVGTVPAQKAILVISNTALTSPATSDTLVTLTPYVDGVAGSAGTSFTPPAGKKWRVTNFTVTWRNTAASIQTVTGFLRQNPTGVITATSPIMAVASGNSNAATIGVGSTGFALFPEGGLQFDPGQNIGVSAIGSAATAGMVITLSGYEY